MLDAELSEAKIEPADEHKEEMGVDEAAEILEGLLGLGPAPAPPPPPPPPPEQPPPKKKQKKADKVGCCLCGCWTPQAWHPTKLYRWVRSRAAFYSIKRKLEIVGVQACSRKPSCRGPLLLAGAAAQPSRCAQGRQEAFGQGPRQHFHAGVREVQGRALRGQDHPVRPLRQGLAYVLPHSCDGEGAGRRVGLPDVHRGR